jgi:hypothetical protein
MFFPGHDIKFGALLQQFGHDHSAESFDLILEVGKRASAQRHRFVGRNDFLQFRME